jgi:CubicO group peptidase (beta-lactamase class C family)
MRGRLTYDAAAAPTQDDTIFDLASLTKVIATTSLVMAQYERGVLGLDDPIERHIRLWPAADTDLVRVRDLLAHCSGLPAYAPFYEAIAGREAFEDAICRTPLAYRPRQASVYSDLGFMLLGFMLDDAGGLGAGFTALWTRIGAGEELQFLPPAAWQHRTAPTEVDPWRGRLLRGEVHDENAAALGGVAGHAGLFGTAQAVGVFARHLLQVLDGRAGFVRSPRGAPMFQAVRARSAGTRCCRPRRAGGACLPAPSVTRASPARRCGSIPNAASMSCC